MTLYPYAIFDMDGTLLDSAAMWDEITAEVMDEVGAAPFFAGAPHNAALTIEGAADLCVRNGLPVTREFLAEKIRAAARRGYAERVALKPGALTAVRALAARGVRMCVASGTEKPLVDGALAGLGIRGYFEFTLGCEAPEGKENPEVYLRAMQAFGAQGPADIMVFEDLPAALATAHAAGFATTAVWDNQAPDAWRAAVETADDVCTDWAEWAAALPAGGGPDGNKKQEESFA